MEVIEYSLGFVDLNTTNYRKALLYAFLLFEVTLHLRGWSVAVNDFFDDFLNDALARSARLQLFDLATQVCDKRLKFLDSKLESINL